MSADLVLFFSQLFVVVVVADDISDEQRAKICKKLAEADKFSDISEFIY